MTGKGTILNFPDTAAAEAEAAAWVARFDAGEVSAKDQAAFQEWLNRSPLHRDLIAQYGSLWSEFDTLGQLARTGKAAASAGAGTGRLLHKSWLAACAAAVLLLAGGVALLHPRLPGLTSPHGSISGTKQIARVQLAPRQLAQSANLPAANRAAPMPPQPVNLASAVSSPPAGVFYETAIGGQRSIVLADGSSVILNTNSRISVEFSAHRRDVHLLRGEAYFEVIHNKARPFTVYANNYVVRDIGTAFDVHLRRTGSVEVGVTKGSVEVAPASRAQASSAMNSLGVLVAGHDIVLSQNAARAEAVAAADLDRKLAWRQGDLIYTGQPLGEVLSDVSRYSAIKIELADPALKDIPVGGAFRIDQIPAIFAALENNFGLHAEWSDALHVRFTSGREKAPPKD